MPKVECTSLHSRRLATGTVHIRAEIGVKGGAVRDVKLLRFYPISFIKML